MKVEIREGLDFHLDRAYYGEGEPVGDRATLLRPAGDAGLEAT